MKVLVTGSRGFVAHHLKVAFEAHGASIFGVDRVPAAPGVTDYAQLDLMDKAAIKRLLAEQKPDAIVHLPPSRLSVRAGRHPSEAS